LSVLFCGNSGWKHFTQLFFLGTNSFGGSCCRGSTVGNHWWFFFLSLSLPFFQKRRGALLDDVFPSGGGHFSHRLSSTQTDRA
jgi:hypothetical protein